MILYKENMADLVIIPIGPHRAWIEPPDIFVTHWHGEVHADEMLAMYVELEAFSKSCSHILALNILNDTPTLGREAREVASHDPRNRHFQAMAMVGAGFHVRIITTMMIKAARLLHVSDNKEVAFVSTADEGRAWLAKYRESRAKP